MKASGGSAMGHIFFFCEMVNIELFAKGQTNYLTDFKNGNLQTIIFYQRLQNTSPIFGAPEYVVVAVAKSKIDAKLSIRKISEMCSAGGGNQSYEYSNDRLYACPYHLTGNLESAINDNPVGEKHFYVK